MSLGCTPSSLYLNILSSCRTWPTTSLLTMTSTTLQSRWETVSAGLAPPVPWGKSKREEHFCIWVMILIRGCSKTSSALRGRFRKSKHKKYHNHNALWCMEEGVSSCSKQHHEALEKPLMQTCPESVIRCIFACTICSCEKSSSNMWSQYFKLIVQQISILYFLHNVFRY